MDSVIDSLLFDLKSVIGYLIYRSCFCRVVNFFHLQAAGVHVNIILRTDIKREESSLVASFDSDASPEGKSPDTDALVASLPFLFYRAQI
ncbi:hypothetical protein RO3G_05845 [Rhizopus delemar RA 99-880]|uniref:Uncharacterized protein n=1 Tax=Rhizopus delemar (strain RA 99-880 / ATCC MYA-4621 / FGSC 9543 / NRRL 43880) TaxID=246409 RepID=I1BY60_RHIO9|nr:hypothetical protein RO3G_05845 [Rhizopus delemar RA 99-880]|eukprot:EIE81140.1 hypothetical protein RO3G_05845 [Rhizopus delemar RA 99-880]